MLRCCISVVAVFFCVYKYSETEITLANIVCRINKAEPGQYWDGYLSTQLGLFFVGRRSEFKAGT